MSDKLAVEARGLVKRYGEKLALAGIDLAVPTGTVMAVLGPNGAGKTTAVRILTTLTEADEGDGHRGRLRRADPGRRGAPPHRPRRAGRHGRSAAHRPGEPRDARRAAPALPQGGSDSRRRAARGVLAHRRRRPRQLGLLGRHAPPARPRRHARGPAPGAVPRRADHRPRSTGPGRAVGRARRPRRPGVRPSLLTTQYLDEAERLADDIVVIDLGRIIAQGDARQLKRDVGGDHLHVVVVDAGDLADRGRPAGAGQRRPPPRRHRRTAR